MVLYSIYFIIFNHVWECWGGAQGGVRTHPSWCQWEGKGISSSPLQMVLSWLIGVLGTDLWSSEELNLVLTTEPYLQLHLWNFRGLFSCPNVFLLDKTEILTSIRSLKLGQLPPSCLLPLLYNEVSNCKMGTILIKLGNSDTSLYFKDKINKREEICFNKISLQRRHWEVLVMISNIEVIKTWIWDLDL